MDGANKSSWEETISFAACCDFFESLAKEDAGGKARRIRKFETFLEQLRRIAKNFSANTWSNAGSIVSHSKSEEISTKPHSMFPFIRLLLPQLDRERGAYGIKETLLAKLFIGLLQLGPNSQDAMKLKNYRAPTSSKCGQGDLADVLYSVIKDRQYGSSTTGNRRIVCPNIGEINARLDEIPVVCATKGRTGPDGVEGILMNLFKRLNAIQVKWLVRIILKDMHLGLGQNTILNTFHPDAREFYDVNANLRKVTELLYDPNVRRNEIEVTLFDPFRPMLAERGDIDMEKVVEKQISGNQFYVEVKYDGERIQIHKDANHNYRYFSRNGNEFTEDFGENRLSKTPGSGELKFCSYLHQALSNGKVSTLILDGEICAYNKLTESVTQKGEHMSIRGIRPEDALYQQCLFVYDILLLNDKVLTNLPLHQRLDQLHIAIPKELKGRVHYSQRKLATSAKELTDALNQAIDRREEGIVVKDPNGVYRPNARGGHGGWLKIKPEYNNELSDHLDLIVLGGYYGSTSSGRGGAGSLGNLPVTHFLLGVLNVENESLYLDGNIAKEQNRVTARSGNKELFHSFCRVGSGYSNKELFDLLQRLHPHFRKWGKEEQRRQMEEIGIRLGKEPKPDVWLDPKKSVVVQVKAAEIVSSEVYNVGCTLRFPRVVMVRDDKSWPDCTSLQEVYSLKNRSCGKLAKRQHVVQEQDEHMGFNDDAKELKPIDGSSVTDDVAEFAFGMPSKKGNKRIVAKNDFKKSSPVKKKRLAELPCAYMAIDSKNVVSTTSALEGRVVVIEPSSIPTYKELKSQLEQIVVKHGGTVEQNVAAGRTFCYVETAGTARAKSVAGSGLYDVIRPQWLLDCDTKFRPFRPSDMLFTTETTDREFRENCFFDEYGDSYIQRATKDSLQYSMKVAAQSITHEQEQGRKQCLRDLRREMAKLEQESFPPNWKFGLFRSVVIYVDRYAVIGDSSTPLDEFHHLILPEISVTFYGGKGVVEDFICGDGGGVTHVLTHSRDQGRLDEIRKIRRILPQGRKFRIVNEDWVDACLNAERLISETEYEL